MSETTLKWITNVLVIIILLGIMYISLVLLGVLFGTLAGVFMKFFLLFYEWIL